MTKFIGRRGVLGIAKETVRGTAVAPAYWIPNSKMSFFDTTETVGEEQGLGVVADQDSSYVTFTMGQGTVDAQLYDQALGYILMSLLGAAPVTSGSNPYTHTYTLSQTNQAQSLSLYWKDPDRSYIFPLAVIDSLQISVTAKGLVEYTFGAKSKAAKDYTTQTQNFTSVGNKFTHQHLQVRLASAVGGLAGASRLALNQIELNISRNTIYDEAVGTVEPIDVLSQELSVEGSLTLKNEDETYHNLMRNGTYNAMEFKLLRSASSSLQLQLPRVSFTEWEPDYTLNQIANQTVNFKGNYDAANALDIISTAVLINAKSSY